MDDDTEAIPVIDLADGAEEPPKGKGKGPGPPLPKPQARKASDVPASRSLRHFHFQRPPNLDRGGVVVMSNDPADRELALLVRHLTDSGRHQKDIRIEHALLNLGRLRALRYERNQFNAAARPVDGQRFMEMCSSCGVQAGERPVKLEGLDDLITALEGEIQDLEEHRKDISCGYVQFNGLGEVFYPGEKVWMTIDGLSEPLGLTVLQSWYQLRSSLFGPEKSFHVELEFMASLGGSFAKVNYQEPMSSYQGTRRLDSLLYQLMTPDMMERLKRRGEKYLQAATSTPYMHYARGSFYSHGRSKHAALADGRVMLDTQKGQEYGHHAARGGDHCSLALQHAVKAYKLQQKHGTDSLRIFSDPKDEELWMFWPALVGFSFTAKCWGQVLVAETEPISFRADAFEKLVLPMETKEIIRSAVRHASSSGLDFISGKGDNTIFLLYGPPGSGKTLTAEAIAEMLHMPLYVVTAGDLGISATEVEQNLSQVLHLCSEWNALTLIDEADIFLEARSTSELQRNALVCVMLRLLEYHQGILFLTTNRASNIDPAVRSRITVALHYEPLSRSGRESVWANLLQKVPHGAVDPAQLARHSLNGRQIKSCLLLANALASERQEALSDALIERAVAVVGEVQQDELEAPHPTRRVLMPGKLPEAHATAQTPRVSREGLLQPRSSVPAVLPSSLNQSSSRAWDLRQGVLGHDGVAFSTGPGRIPDPSAFPSAFGYL